MVDGGGVRKEVEEEGEEEEKEGWEEYENKEKEVLDAGYREVAAVKERESKTGSQMERLIVLKCMYRTTHTLTHTHRHTRTNTHTHLSSICVAITTGFPSILHVSIILFWIGGTSHGFISTPKTKER